jgi:hypothetical protein
VLRPDAATVRPSADLRIVERHDATHIDQSVLAQLPTVQPVAGSGELWIDTANGNVVKVAL